MFLNTLIQASIQGGLIIVVLFLGLKLAPTLSPKVRLWLWRLVFVKLALSLLPLGGISLKILPPSPAPVEAVASPLGGAERFSESAPSSTFPNQSWVMAWIAGVTVAGIISLWRARSCHEAIETARLTSDASAQSAADYLVQQLGSRRRPLVMVSNEVPTAVVMGSRRPTILLPEDMEKSEDLSLILAHELVHVAHRDLEWNAFASFVECLFFFHPLVWLAARSVNQAQEAAADAAAIRVTNTSPKRYGEMLMRATLFTSPRPAGALSLGGSTDRIRTRLNELKHFNAKPTLSRLVAGTLLSLTVIAMTPAYQLAARDAIPVPGYPVAATMGRQGLAVLGRPQARRSHARSKRSSSRVTHSRRQSGKIRVIRPRGAGRAVQIEVVPTVAPAIAVSFSPEAARGVSVAVAATPARSLSVSVAPHVARAIAVSYRQNGKGRSHSEPVRAASVAPRAAISTASEVSVSTSPSSSHSASVSVSSGGEATPAAAVSVASSPSAIAVSSAPAVAASPKAISVATTAAGRSGSRSRARVDIHKGAGKGSSSGSGRGKGSGSGHYPEGQD